MIIPIKLLLVTVIAVVQLLAAGDDPAVYELPVIDGNAAPAVQLPAAPDDPGDCAVFALTYDEDGSPHLGDTIAYPFGPGELRVSVVGSFAWIQWDRPDVTDADSSAPDIGSVPLTGETLEVCR